MKLTKAQREFFKTFTESAIQNLLIAASKPEHAVQVQQAAQAALAGMDTDALVEATGSAFLERVDFATIKRVHKLLTSEDYQKVSVASAQVLGDVEDLLGAALGQVANSVEEVIIQKEAE